jgi:hypothetical protein
MSSVIRQARINLMAIATSVLPDDATVFYGKRLPMFTAPITFQIYGWAASRNPEELSPLYRVDEVFDFNCCISSFEGDQDWDARELECITQFNALIIAVNNNYTLGNTVRWAYLTDYEFIPDTTTSAGQSLGSLDFKIHCEQRIESLT